MSLDLEQLTELAATAKVTPNSVNVVVQLPVTEEMEVGDDEFVPPIYTIVDNRREGVQGRAAFAPDTCPYHGGTRRVPCSKFAHLPGKGRGPVQPTLWQICGILLRALVVPLLWLALIGGILYGLSLTIDGGILPGMP
jgi:hypothetical protein